MPKSKRKGMPIHIQAIKHKQFLEREKLKNEINNKHKRNHRHKHHSKYAPLPIIVDTMTPKHNPYNLEITPNLRYLLNHGPKFNPQSKPSPQLLLRQVLSSFSKYARSLRWKYHFNKGNPYIEERHSDAIGQRYEDSKSQADYEIDQASTEVQRLLRPVSTRRPPRSCKPLEDYLARVLVKLKAAVIIETAHRRNVHPGHQALLQSIRDVQTDPSITVLETDKNLGFAILPRSVHNKLLSDELHEPRNFIKMDSRVFAEFFQGAETSNQIRAAHSSVIGLFFDDLRVILSRHKHIKSRMCFGSEIDVYDEVARFILAKENKTDELTFVKARIMPKIHKEFVLNDPAFQLKTRLVTPSNSSAFSNVCRYLSAQLMPVMTSARTYLKDTDHLQRVLESHTNRHEHSTIFSADIVAFYPNIDIVGLYDLIRDYLLYWIKTRPHGGYRLMDEADVPFIMDLIKRVCQLNIIYSGGEWFRQIRGLSMGNEHSPVIACIVASAIEHKFYNCDIQRTDADYETHGLPNFYGNPDLIPTINFRFIDDIFKEYRSPKLGWHVMHGLQKFFLSHGLEIFPVMADKMELEDGSVVYTNPVDHSTNFLDISVTEEFPGGPLVTRLYQKANNAHQYIPPHSQHAPHVFSFARSEVIRINRRNSDPSNAAIDTAILHGRLSDRGFSDLELSKHFADPPKRNLTLKRKAATIPRAIYVIEHNAHSKNIDFNKLLRIDPDDPLRNEPTFINLFGEAQRPLVAKSNTPNLGRLFAVPLRELYTIKPAVQAIAPPAVNPAHFNNPANVIPYKHAIRKFTGRQAIQTAIRPSTPPSDI